MDTVPVSLPAGAEPGSVVELYRAADGTMAAQVRIPAPRVPVILPYEPDVPR